ncbi:hypothetical protein [Micromonospora sp. WMMD1155]|uniref:hypothetical protein n=1 Tax=Micromonospora sp. WMMD1155 TaxID=3016094 RepID=UPI00249A4AA5|nr:hypothetical protein [Micromonospora sp. WMMD1155]WFE53177.1 hypothetical protein O7617_23940 [Micromonospora sp. WMMD1155]
MAATSEPAVGVTAVAAAVVLLAAAGVAGLWALAMARLSVHVNTYQVAVRHPLLPGPSATVPLRQIRRMSVVHGSARPWTVWWCPWPGGWGRAAVIRTGPALRLELTSGRAFVVSVDEPEGAVRAFRRLR